MGGWLSHSHTELPNLLAPFDFGFNPSRLIFGKCPAEQNYKHSADKGIGDDGVPRENKPGADRDGRGKRQKCGGSLRQCHASFLRRISYHAHVTNWYRYTFVPFRSTVSITARASCIVWEALI